MQNNETAEVADSHNKNLLGYIEALAFLQREARRDGLRELENHLQSCVDACYARLNRH